MKQDSPEWHKCRHKIKHKEISEIENPKKGDLARSQGGGITQQWSIYIYIPCVKCGKPRWLSRCNYNSGSQGDYCHKCVMGIVNTGPKHFKWKEKQTRGGYVYCHIEADDPFYAMVNADGRRILEHRLLMARHLGRCLEPHEIVHHINGNKIDNRIENLKIVSRSNHHLKEHLDLLKERVALLEKSNLLLWAMIFHHSQSRENNG